MRAQLVTQRGCHIVFELGVCGGEDSFLPIIASIAGAPVGPVCKVP